MSSTSTSTSTSVHLQGSSESTTTSKSQGRRQRRRRTLRIVNQREISWWTLVAVGQTLVWAVGIPWVCRRHLWDRFFPPLLAWHPRYGHCVAEFLFTVTIPPLFLVVYTLVMIPIYAGNYSCFEQYRIQPSQCWPWFDPNPAVREAFWKLSRKSIKLACFNMLVLVPLLVALKLYLETVLLETDKTFFFQTDDAHWPSTAQNFTNILRMVLVHELGFYATHRMMHTHPWLYRYHKVHHEYKANTALAAQHNHPVDHLICIGTPAVIAILAVPSAHSISQGLFMVWGMWANLDDHVGYAFPWSPVRWFVGSSSTDEHEFHHAINRGCYSTKLSCYNRLLGGYEHYDDYCREQQLYGNEPPPRTESVTKME